MVRLVQQMRAAGLPMCRTEIAPGVRAIFVTHLHELAENIETLHATSAVDSRFASLVAGSPAGEANRSGSEKAVEGAAQMARRTYQIRPAPPMGPSLAKDIARRHGISYEQLAQELFDGQKEGKKHKTKTGIKFGFKSGLKREILTEPKGFFRVILC